MQHWHVWYHLFHHLNPNTNARIPWAVSAPDICLGWRRMLVQQSTCFSMSNGPIIKHLYCSIEEGLLFQKKYVKLCSDYPGTCLQVWHTFLLRNDSIPLEIALHLQFCYACTSARFRYYPNGIHYLWYCNILPRVISIGTSWETGIDMRQKRVHNCSWSGVTNVISYNVRARRKYIGWSYEPTSHWSTSHKVPVNTCCAPSIVVKVLESDIWSEEVVSKNHHRNLPSQDLLQSAIIVCFILFIVISILN